MMIVIFKVSRKELLLFWNLGQSCLDNGMILPARLFPEDPAIPVRRTSSVAMAPGFLRRQSH